MKFNKIRQDIKGLDFEALRTDAENYFEAVIIKKELDKLNEKLNNFFGTPAWPSKSKLAPKTQETIKCFGGIKSGQTLYFKNDGGSSIFAMLWPWQDGSRITVKIVRN